MRVLITGQSYHPAFNGQAVFTVNLAEGLAARGHEVMVVASSDCKRPYCQTRNGVQIRRLGAISLSHWHRDAALTPFPDRALGKILREFRPHIVHIQDHYPISRSAVRLARLQGIKTLGTNHFMPQNLKPYLGWLAQAGGDALDWLLWHWMLHLYNQLDFVTAPSRTAVAILQRVGLTTPAFPVSCGVDVAFFRPLPHLDPLAWRRHFQLAPDRTVFLYVGRVDGEKRLDVLLRACQRLQDVPVQLAIAGRGAAQGELQHLAQKLGLDDQVRFLGFVPQEELPALLNSVDIFAMPSDAELLSIATLEAMACGRPVLAARGQALPELITEGVNGLLFQPGDPADAARQMARLVQIRDAWAQMGQANRTKAEFHHVGKTVEIYEQIYESLVSDMPSPYVSAARRPNRPIFPRKVQELLTQFRH